MFRELRGGITGWGDLRMTAQLTNEEVPLGAPLKVPSAAHPGFFFLGGECLSQTKGLREILQSTGLLGYKICPKSNFSK